MGRLRGLVAEPGGPAPEEDEEIIVLASHDVAEPGQVGNNGPIAILPVQSDHRLTQGRGLDGPLRFGTTHVFFSARS